MKLDSIDYKDYEITTPYPEITKNERDPLTASKLIHAYAGSKGELTAVTQYSYQSFISKQNNDKLSSLLIKIAIKEMHHLELLSQLLLSMGINPKFCRYIDNNIDICSNWSTNTLSYITDTIDFLTYNISLENDAINMYTNLLSTTTQNNIKEVILRIIQDEKSHLALFTTLLDHIEKRE